MRRDDGVSRPARAVRNYSLKQRYYIVLLAVCQDDTLLTFCDRGAQLVEIPIQGHQRPEAVDDVLRQLRREDALVQRPIVLEIDGLPVVPRLEQRRRLALAPGILRPTQRKDLLLVELPHQTAQRLGVLVEAPAVGGHQRRAGTPEAHAVAVIVRPDLKIEGGATRPVLIAGADAEPQVILVRPLPVEPPGAPVDAGQLQQKRIVGTHLVNGVIDLLRQRPRGGQQMLLIVLLMLHEPAPLVVEANAPQKVHRFLRISLKCHIAAPWSSFVVGIVPGLRHFCKERKHNKKETSERMSLFGGAGDRTRTGTLSPAVDFEFLKK